MATPSGMRSLDEAAAVLGTTRERVEEMIGRGELRALPVAGGGWVTTDAALQAVQGGRSDRARPRRRRRPAAAAPAAPARPALPEKPPEAQEVDSAPAPAPRRSVPVDIRRDVEPGARLDMLAAAALLGVDRDEAVRLARTGRLRATRLGREWVTTSRDVRACAQARARRGRAARRAEPAA